MRSHSSRLAFMTVIAALALATEAVATELQFAEKRSHTNVVAAGVGGLRNQMSGSITISGASGTVTKAYLYWQGPTNSTSPTVNSSITVNGTPVVGSNIGFGHDCNWGFSNSQAYRADVTAIVTGNGTYSLTGFKIDSSETANGANTNGASLIVFSNGGAVTSRRDVYLFHGNDTNVATAFDGTGWHATLSGINYSAGTANLQVHVGDGQDFGPDQPDKPLLLNGNQLTPSTFDGNTVPSTNTGPNNNGNLWDIRSYSVSSFLAAGSNTLTADESFDCLALVAVVVDVPNTNQAPVATADQYVVNVGQTLTVGAPGVLANDVDPDGDPLTAQLVSGPLHAATGGFTLNSDGSFTYTPAAGFTGTDSFTYTANDGASFEGPPPASSIGFVTIKVNDPNAQTANVQNFSSTCEATLNLTFNAGTTDTFVIRPTDFHKSWHCHLLNLTTGQEVPPKSVHGAPGITLQIDPTVPGDLQKLLAGQTATFEARGNLCQVFDITDGNYKASCSAENSITDPTVDPAGNCIDPNTTGCLGAPIRTYVAPAQDLLFGATGGSIAPGDQCPTLDGGAGEGAAGTGCPIAYQLLVTLNKHALANVAVRIFSRNSPSFLQVTGGNKNPPSTLYPKIYEADQGRVGSCLTDTFGRCTAGIPLKEALLILVKFTNPTTGKADYDGSPASSSDFKTSPIVGTKELSIKR